MLLIGITSRVNIAVCLCVPINAKSRKVYALSKKSLRTNMFKTLKLKNKKERYSRVPRLSDTRYSANGNKRKWRYASSKAKLKCAT